MTTPLNRLRYHVTGAIERGESTAIVAVTTAKPLTKALHTTRVIERIALHLCATTIYGSPAALLDNVLAVLGNAMPDSPALLAQCLTACKRAL